MRTVPNPNMNKQPNSTGILDAARRYAELGLPIIPLVGKVPAVRAWQTFVANEVNLRLHFGTQRCNVGLRTGESGYIAVDTDTPEAEAYVLRRLPESPMRAVSGGGSTHRYYGRPPRKEIRNRQGWKRIPGLDIRGQGGYIVLPPSIHPETGAPYRWLTDLLRPEDLPRFSPAWVYQRTRRRIRTLIIDDSDSAVRRARAYLTKVEGAVSGAGGHNTTMRVAGILIQKFGLTIEQAWPLFVEWNRKCEPAWSDQELLHKLQDAHRLK
jgi:hypothetical protein